MLTALVRVLDCEDFVLVGLIDPLTTSGCRGGLGHSKRVLHFGPCAVFYLG